jgi:tRNA 2-thiouridine synthesizing protein A
MPDVEELDLTGLKCPLPALMTAKALRRLAPGAELSVIVTDALAPIDIRFLCERDGHEFLDEDKGNGATRLRLRAGPK